MQDKLDQLNNEIILKIESKLKELKKNDKWLADQSGIVPAGISQIMNKKRVPTLYTLLRISQALKIDLSEFFNGEASILNFNDRLLKSCLVFWIISNSKDINHRKFADLMNDPNNNINFLIDNDISLDWFFSNKLEKMPETVKNKLIKIIQNL